MIRSTMHPSSSAESTCNEIPILLYRKHQFPSSCIGPVTFCLVPDPTPESITEGGDEKNIKVRDADKAQQIGKKTFSFYQLLRKMQKAGLAMVPSSNIF